MDHVENKASKNIIEDNIEKLKDLFPEAFTESSDEGEPRWKVDFETLKQILGDYTENRQERYSFSWNGKSRARLIAQTPSTGTLRPCPEESVDWDTTKNLFIEGDNLEVLKLLQKSYHKKVKMIYIDPPYNTGNEFIYPDKFQDNLDTYLRYTGQVDDEGFKVSTNSETGGRYHTNWLNMMYPRLKLARNLLRDDGVIFISVGKEELHNLIKTMNEIYGEECHKNIIVIRRGIKSVQAQFETIDSFNRGHEYLVFYSKSSNYRFNKCLIPNTFDDEEEVEGSWNNHWRGTDRPTMRYELFGIKPKNGQWRWGEARSLKAKENWKNLCEEIGSNPSQKEIDTWVMKKEKEYGERIDLLRLSSTSKPEHYIHPSEGKLASDLWSDLKPNGGNQFKRIMEGNYFDTPKSVDLIYRLLSFLSGPNDIVLDFFAGSATTAHSTFKLNCEENSFRNFIMVQLPEPTKEDSEAYKAGYKTIAEIGKERIRRAAKKIQGENPDYDGDLGFKVFKLDSSNIKPWDADFDNYKEALMDSVENIKSERTEQDVLYELLLKYGLDLTIPIETRSIQGKNVYIIGAGALVVCLDDEITLDAVEGIAKLKEELKPEIMRVVFKDAGFKDATVKTNTVQILKIAGIEDVKSL